MSRLVSIVIPARNAELTIGRALTSVLYQDYKPIEVIVVDDASDDNTARIVCSMADPAVRLIRLSKSLGAAAARNHGIDAALGEIIAFQDADDEWLSGKLAQQVHLLLSNPALVLVSSQASFISATGEDLGLLFGGAPPAIGDRAWPALLARNTIATPTVIAWRKHLLDLGGFDCSLQVAEDQDMWIRLAMRGSLGALVLPLARVHAVQNSLSFVRSRESFFQQLEFTLPMVERHVAAKRHEMSQAEIRRVFAERWGRLGRAAYSQGNYLPGLRFILRAAGLGFEPFGALKFLLSATPPMPWIKRLVRDN